MAQKNTFFFFVSISLSWYALHLHHGEGDSEQVGGQARSAPNND